jgi:very-short-patch-repair endonuclease
MIKKRRKICSHGFVNCLQCKKIKTDAKYERLTKNSSELTKKRKEAKLSKGEVEVSKALDYLCLKYEREKAFKGLYNHNNRYLLYFDFYIPSENLCIEFDGAQHYSVDKKESEKVNDFKKNMFCKKNNINLLRIKYTDIDKVESIIVDRLLLLKSKVPKSEVPKHTSNYSSNSESDLWESL